MYEVCRLPFLLHVKDPYYCGHRLPLPVGFNDVVLLNKRAQQRMLIAQSLCWFSYGSFTSGLIELRT
jgi:hypothetical protein